MIIKLEIADLMCPAGVYRSWTLDPTSFSVSPDANPATFGHAHVGSKTLSSERNESSTVLYMITHIYRKDGIPENPFDLCSTIIRNWTFYEQLARCHRKCASPLPYLPPQQERHIERKYKKAEATTSHLEIAEYWCDSAMPF